MRHADLNSMGIFSTDTTPPDPEEERFRQLSQIVSLGVKQFAKIGLALSEIRDRELYRCQFDTFEECCRDQWNMTRQHAARLIEAAAICRELEPTGSVPENEHQTRVLSRLPKDEREAAWKEAIDQGGTAAALHKAVAKRKAPRSKKHKPIRIRVPGATVVIEPNGRFTTTEETLTYAIDKMAARAKKAA